MANRFGEVHTNHPFGMSMVVDPRGIAVSLAQGRSCFVYGAVDPADQEAAKRNLAVWENRRADVYEV